MSLQSKYASVVASELRHHAVWEPGEPVRLGDYGVLQGSRFTVHGNIEDDFGLQFEVVRSRSREFAFRSDGVSESRGEGKANQPGAVAELRVGFRRADALYVSSPSSWTEQIKGLGRIVTPLLGNPQWNPEWVIVTRLYHASQAIILLSNSDNADVRLNLAADGAPVGGKSANDVGEQGSVALQLTGVRGPLFMGLHRVHRDLVDVIPRQRLVNRVLVLAGAGLLASGALASWLVVSWMTPGEAIGDERPTVAQATSLGKGDARPDDDTEAVEAAEPDIKLGGIGTTGAGAGGSGTSPDHGSGQGTSPATAGAESDAPKGGDVRVRVDCPGGAEILGPKGERLGRCGDAGIKLKGGEKALLAVVSKTRASRAVELDAIEGGHFRVDLEPLPRPVAGGGLKPDGTAPQGVSTSKVPGRGVCRTPSHCAAGDLCIAGHCVLPPSKSAITDLSAADDTTSGGQETPPLSTTGEVLGTATASAAVEAATTSAAVEAATTSAAVEVAATTGEGTTEGGSAPPIGPSVGPTGALRRWLWLALVGVLAGVGLLVAWALRRRGAEPVVDVAPIVEPPPGA